MRQTWHLLTGLALILVLYFLGCSSSRRLEEGSLSLLSGSGFTFNLLAPNDLDQTPHKVVQSWAGNSPALMHMTGQSWESTGWRAQASVDGPGLLNFGPYYPLPASGNYRVDFQFNQASAYRPGAVLVLDVFNSTANQVVTAREVWPEEFENGNLNLHLTFHGTAGSVYEFRSYYLGGMDLTLRQIILSQANEGVLGQWFNGRLQPRPVATMPGGTGTILVNNGVWYHFERSILPQEITPSFCQTGGSKLAISMVVRTSSDQGKTWSQAREVVRPSLQAGAKDACLVLDGATFYNEEAQQWQIFTQCLGDATSAWSMCLYGSSNVTGPYSRVMGMALEPKQLWNLICDGVVCNKGSVFDEGTPEFVARNYGYYYFTFHGYDGMRGFRGMVRTRDFVTWEGAGPGLPGIPMYASRDCDSKTYPDGRPCIGGGAATTARSGDYTYMLIEAPSASLACTDGQYWPMVLTRSSHFQKSGLWEDSPVNPVLKPLGNFGCGLQYAKFIHDQKDIFLYYSIRRADNTWNNSLYYLGRDSAGTTASGSSSITYLGNSSGLYHQLGQAEGKTWSVYSTQGSGVMSYGPYATNWPATPLTATFRLAVDNNSADNQLVASIEVFDATTQTVLVRRDLYRKNMAGPFQWRDFNLAFSNEGRAGHRMETRVIVYGKTYLKLDRILLNPN